ncbi:MAG: ankyrin repeat domain-containing protein, partial [Acidobacteria bacterium]|nr:ankyrin repeat domain-containing protein [Acidobacteriota bacterium]
MRGRMTVGAALLALAVMGTTGRAEAAARVPPLHAAVEAGDLETVRQVLAQPGAATEATPDGTTALHLATDLDNLAAARMLIEAGADATAANRYGVTPVYSAAVRGNAAVISTVSPSGSAAAASTPHA